MKPGDWVCDKLGLEQWPYQPKRIGRVKHVYPCGSMIDVVLTRPDGEKVGRISEAFGGPTSFEPALDVEDFVVIEEPEFPLTRYEWGRNLKVIE